MEEKKNDYSDIDIENILGIIDGLCNNDVSRIRLEVEDTSAVNGYKREYHHGRCDIGSPYAKGECFDAPINDCDRN